jgi:hypothetical protein
VICITSQAGQQRMANWRGSGSEQSWVNEMASRHLHGRTEEGHEDMLGSGLYGRDSNRTYPEFCYTSPSGVRFVKA